MILYNKHETEEGRDAIDDITLHNTDPKIENDGHETI